MRRRASPRRLLGYGFGRRRGRLVRNCLHIAWAEGGSETLRSGCCGMAQGVRGETPQQKQPPETRNDPGFAIATMRIIYRSLSAAKTRSRQLREATVRSPCEKNAESVVAVIWITCPTTGRSVSTGIETDAESFEALPAFVLTLVCGACGETHPWADMQGQLIDGPPKPLH